MLSSTTNKVQYTIAYPFGDTYTVTFKYWLGVELVAVLSFPAGTADHELLLDTDYSLSAPGETGTLTKLTDWDHAAVRLTIYRELINDQQTDYRNGEAVDMDLLEQDFDRAAARDQQIAEKIERGVTIPISDDDVSLELPAKAARASTLFGWDADGKPIPGAGGVITASPFMATVLDDLTSEAALVTLKAARGECHLTPTTGYTPAAGDVVEVCYDGTIRKAKRTANTVFASGSAVTGARIAKLDATHFCVIYSIGLAIYAQVWVVNQADLVPTAVAAATLVYTCTTVLSGFDVCPIDGNHVLVCYAMTGGSTNFTQGYVRSLTIDVGTGAVTVNAAVSTHANTQAPGLYPVPGSSNIAMMWLISATSVGCCIISGGASPTYNVGGTRTITSTIGSPDSRVIQFCVNSEGILAVGLFKRSASTYTFETAQFIINGTTVTGDANTNTYYPHGNASSWPAIEEGPSVDQWFFLGDFSAVNTGPVAPLAAGVASLVRVGVSVISGNGPAYGTNGISWPDAGILVLKAVDRASGVFACHTATFERSTTIGSTNYKSRLWIMKRQGGRWVFGDMIKYDADVNLGNFAGIDCLSSGIIVAVIATSSATGNGSRVFTIRRRNSILGVAMDATGNVKSLGHFQTIGLIPGTKYYCNDNGDLSTPPSEIEIGFAKSTTELILMIVGGI